MQQVDLRTAKINPKYALDMDVLLKRELKDPEFKKAYEEEKLKYEIARTVKETRQAKHLSQAKLAQQVRTTQRVISNVEQGQVNIGVNLLQRILIALELKIHIS